MKLLGVVLVAAFLAGPVDLLRRPNDPPDKGQGCSEEHWEIVIEQENVFRLCLFEKG